MLSYLKILLLSLCLLFIACSSKEQNPLSSFGKKSDSDPLKIGKTPTPPAKQENPQLLVGKIYFEDEKNKDFDLLLRRDFVQESFSSNSPLVQAFDPKASDTGDWFSLMSANGAVLTVWALAKGNWLWGYTLLSSVTFGDARVWKFRILRDNVIVFQNAKTFTCVNAYGNGVIHDTCDETNPNQQFKAIPMDNEAFMLLNLGTKKCLHVPIGDIFFDFERVSSVFLSPCSPKDNLDQQFYFITPPFLVNPLYDRR